MAYAIVQSQSNFQAVLNPKGKLITNFSLATTPGNLLLFAYAAFSGGSQDVIVTDGTNTYNYGPVVNDDLSTPSGFSMGCIGWAGASPSISAATGITFTNSSPATLANVCVFIFEISGVRSVVPVFLVSDTNPEDASAFGDFGTTSPASPDSQTTTANGDLVFVFTAVDSTAATPISTAAGFTEALQVNPSGNLWIEAQYMTQASAGAINPSIALAGTLSGDWVCLATSFLAP
jgi:hypothetical protein